ncbi:MAG: hypothetical protein HQK49_09995 [Oligoflexia bacterium]|nr:hypothetical protein [Oligoflexia bacterium]
MIIKDQDNENLLTKLLKSVTSIKILSVLLLGIVVITGCSTDGSAPTITISSANTITSVADLPGATTPVTQSYSGDLRKKLQRNKYADIENVIYGKAATTGVKLKDVAYTNFSSATTKSRTACESFSMLKQAYSKASQPDKIKCYIGNISDNYALAGLSAGDINETGTRYNYFKIEEDSFTGYVKFKIKKSTLTGEIEEFEMFECMNQNVSGQGGYIHTTIVGNNVDMLVKNIGSWSAGSNSGSYATQFTVAAVRSGRNLVSKNMIDIHKGTWSWSGNVGSEYAKVIVDEYTEAFKINAYMHNQGTGSFSYNGSTYNFANSQNATTFGVIQLINPTSGKMSTLAGGDGSMHAILNGYNKMANGSSVSVSDAEACTSNSNGCWVQRETVKEAWLADSNMTTTTFDAANAYGYTEVNASSPSLSITEPTIAFETAESWNCSSIASEDDAAGVTMKTVTIGAALQAKLALCDTMYNFGDEGGNIECWQLEDRN